MACHRLRPNVGIDEFRGHFGNASVVDCGVRTNTKKLSAVSRMTLWRSRRSKIPCPRTATIIVFGEEFLMEPFIEHDTGFYKDG